MLDGRHPHLGGKIICRLDYANIVACLQLSSECYKQFKKHLRFHFAMSKRKISEERLNHMWTSEDYNFSKPEWTARIRHSCRGESFFSMFLIVLCQYHPQSKELLLTASCDCLFVYSAVSGALRGRFRGFAGPSAVYRGKQGYIFQARWEGKWAEHRYRDNSQPYMHVFSGDSLELVHTAAPLPNSMETRLFADVGREDVSSHLSLGTREIFIYACDQNYRVTLCKFDVTTMILVPHYQTEIELEFQSWDLAVSLKNGHMVWAFSHGATVVLMVHHVANKTLLYTMDVSQVQAGHTIFTSHEVVWIKEGTKGRVLRVCDIKSGAVRDIECGLEAEGGEYKTPISCLYGFNRVLHIRRKPSGLRDSVFLPKPRLIDLRSSAIVAEFGSHTALKDVLHSRNMLSMPRMGGDVYLVHSYETEQIMVYDLTAAHKGKPIRVIWQPLLPSPPELLWQLEDMAVTFNHARGTVAVYRLGEKRLTCLALVGKTIGTVYKVGIGMPIQRSCIELWFLLPKRLSTMYRAVKASLTN